MKRTCVSFSTLRYENAYGKKPRGYGDWWFVCKGNGHVTEVNFLTKFGEAKKMAIEFCRNNGYYFCSTLS